MKFLCVCQGGNVRSAALKHILNYAFGQDALSCSAEKNSVETLTMLTEWADYVVLMSQQVRDDFWPAALQTSPKLCLVDVGLDSYGTPFHQGLCDFLMMVVGTWAARDWDLQNRRATETAS